PEVDVTGQLEAEPLHGDAPAQQRVRGGEYLGHATGADHLGQLVAATEQRHQLPPLVRFPSVSRSGARSPGITSPGSTGGAVVAGCGGAVGGGVGGVGAVGCVGGVGSGGDSGVGSGSVVGASSVGVTVSVTVCCVVGVGLGSGSGEGVTHSVMTSCVVVGVVL